MRRCRREISKKVGYSEEEIKRSARGRKFGFGLRQSDALASLKAGETVLDLVRRRI